MSQSTLVAVTNQPERIEIVEVVDEGRLVGYQAYAPGRLCAVANGATIKEALTRLRIDLAAADGQPMPSDDDLTALPLDPAYDRL